MPPCRRHTAGRRSAPPRRSPPPASGGGRHAASPHGLPAALPSYSATWRDGQGHLHRIDCDRGHIYVDGDVRSEV